MRARQRTITALDGAGDQGLWLVPNRRLGGAVPPPLDFDAIVTVGQSGANNGYDSGLYGAIVPSPYVFAGFQLDAVYGTATTVANCLTVGGGGGSLATRLEMAWSGSSEPVVFIYEGTNFWSTSAKAWSDYVRANVGGAVGVTIGAVGGGNFTSTVYQMVVGDNGTFVGYAAAGGYGWNVPGMPLFDTSGIGQFRCRRSDGRTDLSTWVNMTGVYPVQVVVDALAPINFTWVSTSGWQAAGQTVLRDYLLSKIGSAVTVTVTKN